MLKFVKLWGFFISKKLARPFHPIPCPRGYERQRILEAFYEKDRTLVAVPSKEISPECLDEVQGELNQLNFNWVYLTVWFGLRPQEVDNLKDQNLWRVETLATGRKILWVFQTKIITNLDNCFNACFFCFSRNFCSACRNRRTIIQIP
jgi:hypothetical protein